MFDIIQSVTMGEGGPSPEGRDAVNGLVDRFYQELFAQLEPDDKVGRLKLRQRVIDRFKLDFSIDAASVARRNEFQDGSESPTHFLRHECKLQYGPAVAYLEVGQQIDRLPDSAAAVASGEIGFDHLVVIARFAAAVESAVAGSFNESEILENARTSTPGRLWHLCERLRHAIKAEAVAAEQRIAAEERWLKFTLLENGYTSVTGQLDSIGAAVVRTALEPLARRMGDADNRCLPRRYADAAVELATLSLDSGQLRHVATQRPHLQVTTTLETLRGFAGAPAADMEFSAPISFKTVQRLACDSSISRVVFGPDSVVVDVGRARRVVSPATRRALNARDQICQWPGCERTASQSAAHHLVHWVEGGATDLKNMILLCHRHHWMVHEGGWQLVRAKDERLCAIPPAWDYFYRTRAPDENAA